MMAQMKVHGISDKVMGLSSPRTMFFISLEPVKVFCQICPTRFFKDQKDPVFQGLRSIINTPQLNLSLPNLSIAAGCLTYAFIALSAQNILNIK